MQAQGLAPLVDHQAVEGRARAEPDRQLALLPRSQPDRLALPTDDRTAFEQLHRERRSGGEVLQQAGALRIGGPLPLEVLAQQELEGALIVCQADGVGGQVHGDPGDHLSGGIRHPDAQPGGCLEADGQRLGRAGVALGRADPDRRESRRRDVQDGEAPRGHQELEGPVGIDLALHAHGMRRHPRPAIEGIEGLGLEHARAGSGRAPRIDHPPAEEQVEPHPQLDLDLADLALGQGGDRHLLGSALAGVGLGHQLVCLASPGDELGSAVRVRGGALADPRARAPHGMGAPAVASIRRDQVQLDSLDRLSTLAADDAHAKQGMALADHRLPSVQADRGWFGYGRGLAPGRGRESLLGVGPRRPGELHRRVRRGLGVHLGAETRHGCARALGARPQEQGTGRSERENDDGNPQHESRPPEEVGPGSQRSQAILPRPRAPGPWPRHCTSTSTVSDA